MPLMTNLSIAAISLLSVLLNVVEGQYQDLEEPTHIIKFKQTPGLDYAAAATELKTHHRHFVTTLRESDFAAAHSPFSGDEPDFFLENINLGKGFTAVSGIFANNKFLDYLSNVASIDYVEPNQVYKTTHILPSNYFSGQDDTLQLQQHHLQNGTVSKALTVVEKREINEAVRRVKPSNWGLARIQRHEKGDLSDYEFDPNGGKGIVVYVLDTGVYTDHVDFSGRAQHSKSYVKSEDIVDMGGHGTHVAAKIIGGEYGVAKSATVKSVKILNKNGDGSTSGLLKGIEHVIRDATPGKSVVNLSLSGPRSRLLDQALTNLVTEYNIPVFVSAGNAGTDACLFSPSSNPHVFAVGAVDINDAVPKFSNAGDCVSIYAPGANIMSAFIGGPEASKAMDGTSMASPHVAGIAANLMSQKEFSSAAELYDTISALATKDVIRFDSYSSSSTNRNLLAYFNKREAAAVAAKAAAYADDEDEDSED